MQRNTTAPLVSLRWRQTACLVPLLGTPHSWSFETRLVRTTWTELKQAYRRYTKQWWKRERAHQSPGLWFPCSEQCHYPSLYRTHKIAYFSSVRWEDVVTWLSCVIFQFKLVGDDEEYSNSSSKCARKWWTWADKIWRGWVKRANGKDDDGSTVQQTSVCFVSVGTGCKRDLTKVLLCRRCFGIGYNEHTYLCFIFNILLLLLLLLFYSGEM